jgi:CubicO group peptidase (beta-lactamase class C family)
VRETGCARHSFAPRPSAALVHAGIAGPLSMTRTDVVFPAENFADGHDADGATVPAWDFSALAGAGAIRSTVRDLARLLQANLTPPSGELGAAIELTQRLQTKPPVRGLGLGWHIGLGPSSLSTVHWHNGQTAGAHAFVAFDRQQKGGVIVLANSAQLRIDALGTALLQTLRGEPTNAIDLPVPVTVPETALERYVGVFRVSPTFALTVRRDDAHLSVQATGQPQLGMYARSETEFFLRAVDATLTFERNSAGAFDALVLHQNGHDTTARRESPTP